MGQIRKARGTSRRKHRVPLSRHMKVIVTYMLLIAIIFSNMSNPLMNVFAGQKREEFRIHADELQRAAEEALEEGNAVEEPLDIYTKDSSLQKEYDELFAADGTLYEIFPDYERENDLDGMDLRVFLRLSPEADPKSYVLTGEETFIFLYINGGDETAAGRINIDGYISGICSLKSYDAVFNKDKEDKGNGGGHHSNIVIDSKTEADPQPGSTKPEETESAAEEKPTEAEKEATANTDNSGEKSSQSEDETEDNNKSDKSDAVNEDKSQSENVGSESDNSGKENDSDSGNASDTGNTSDTENKEDNSDASDQDPSENEGGSDSENNNDASDTDTSDSEQEDSSDRSDDSNSDSSDTGSNDSSEQEDSDSSADTVASISIHPRFLLAEVLTEDESIPETDEQETESEPETEESQKETTEAPEETEAETSAPESEKETLPQETKTAETSAEESLPQETKEETQPAKESEADSTTETGAAAPEETTPADDTKLSDAPDAVNKVEEESEPSFDRVGALKGETYNLASLDQTVTIRAFTAKLADMGYDKDELESQGHIIDYMIDPTGSAELVKAPKLVRDGAEVVFGVIPQTGYRLMEVTANGVELEEVEAEDIASPSNATKADEAVYYVIPEVLEDQEVEIFLEEEIPGSHPAFEYAETLNGVTVSISAADGILPEGTTAKIAEVTENVENAVKEKVESEASETAAVEVNAVLAYDITLYDAQGNVLNDSWSRNGYVKVSFSGAPIEEKSKEAAVIDISHLDTDVDTTEGIVTVDEIKGMEQVAEEVVVPDESVESVGFEAKHFSTYTVTFYKGSTNLTASFKIVDLNGNEIGKEGSFNFDNILKPNTEITVETLAKKISDLEGSEFSNKYVFARAEMVLNNNKLITPERFTKIKFVETGWWTKKHYLQIYGEKNGWSDISSNSDLRFVFTEPITGSALTVTGSGTAEIWQNGTKIGEAKADVPLNEFSLFQDIPYTLKFKPEAGYAVGAVYINNQAIPLNDIKNNEYMVSAMSGKQDIRVYFSAISTPGLNWKRSDNKPGTDKGVKNVDSKLDFDWGDIKDLKVQYDAWDKGTYYQNYAGNYKGRSFATWKFGYGVGQKYSIRRFQTTFTIPDGYSVKDYVRLKTSGTDEYSQINDGNIIPINDDIFIFVYKADDKNKITNSNYTNYLAFWSGTSNQDGEVSYKGIKGTKSTRDDYSHATFPYTDGWYCEADLDNIGKKLFDNYYDDQTIISGPNGTKFVLDVFAADYNTAGGMDELMLEFVKSGDYAVKINYYKDEITSPDDKNYLGSESLKGLELGTIIDLATYGDGSLLDLKRPNGYESGVQENAPYIVVEDGVINVLYVTQKQPVTVKYYTRDTADNVAEGTWTFLGQLEEEKFPLGWTYEQSVNKLYGKNNWINPEESRDWYDDGIVVNGENVIDTSTKEIHVVYTRKYGSVDVTKVLEGNTTTSAVKSVQFQLYHSNESWDNGEMYGSAVNAVQNEADVTTGTVNFTQIPGGYYILKETKTAPGYNALTFGIRLQITLDDEKNVICKFYDLNGNEITEDGKYYNQSVEMKDGKMIIYNKAGIILPDTGGQGLDSIHRIGWSVILTSIAYAGFKLSQTIKRKREE